MDSMRAFFRRALPAFLLALGAAALAGCGPAAGSGAAPAGAVQELKWEALVPKDWDPTKRYRNLSLESLRDNDPRAIQMLDEMRAVWDNAPVNVALDGTAARLSGFVVPLDNTQGGIREFLLVPYFGACIHTPPPPANQIIHVKNAAPSQGLQGLRSMDVVWVTGKLQITRADTMMGVSGYHVSAESVARYTAAAAK